MSCLRLVPRYRPFHSSSSAFQSSDAAKANVARAALSLLSPQFATVGVGSGSTIVPFVQQLASTQAHASRVYVPTSWQARHLLLAHNLPVAELDQVDSIDITFDGADDIDSSLNVIKGGGACHLREKVVAERSKQLVILADWTKRSQTLGSGTWTKGVPIEVVPCALDLVQQSVAKFHGFMSCQLRTSTSGKAGPVITDNGNFVLDTCFTPSRMATPRNLLKNLKVLTGVVEVGLFVDCVSFALIGNQDGSVVKIGRTSA